MFSFCFKIFLSPSSFSFLLPLLSHSLQPFVFQWKGFNQGEKYHKEKEEEERKKEEEREEERERLETHYRPL